MMKTNPFLTSECLPPPSNPHDARGDTNAHLLDPHDARGSMNAHLLDPHDARGGMNAHVSDPHDSRSGIDDHLLDPHGPRGGATSKYSCASEFVSAISPLLLSLPVNIQCLQTFNCSQAVSLLLFALHACLCKTLSPASQSWLLSVLISFLLAV
jgi:hypothetical protein